MSVSVSVLVLHRCWYWY